MSDCRLCDPPDERVLWRERRCRIVLVSDRDYPGYCRVIWNAHVREMTDLDARDGEHLMSRVFAVERIVRELLRPDKINLASFGNQVPHLHWHVIARFRDDAHFPEPVWGARLRAGQPHPVDAARLEAVLRERLAAAP